MTMREMSDHAELEIVKREVIMDVFREGLEDGRIHLRGTQDGVERLIEASEIDGCYFDLRAEAIIEIGGAVRFAKIKINPEELAAVMNNPRRPT